MAELAPHDATPTSRRRARVAGRLRRPLIGKARSQAASLEARVYELSEDLARRNDRLQATLDHLQQAQAQLVHSEKMASLGQLVAGLVHEINNPISFIFSGLNLLETNLNAVRQLLADLEGQLPEERRSDTLHRHAMDRFHAELEFSLSSFKEGANRIRELVSGLKTFSRQDVFDYHEVDLASALAAAVQVIRDLHRDYLDFEIDLEPVPGITASEGHLTQVFLNLLLNACQAIEERGTITVRTRAEADHVIVEIADDGPGIAPEVLPHIFEPFFTTKPVGAGTGLGLSICHGIVEKHNGRILVETTPGEGTCFQLVFPRAGTPVGLPRTGP